MFIISRYGGANLRRVLLSLAVNNSYRGNEQGWQGVVQWRAVRANVCFRDKSCYIIKHRYKNTLWQILMKRNILFGLTMIVALLAAEENINATQSEVLRFAITSAVASDPSFNTYRELTGYVAKRIGRKSVFISGLSYTEVDNLFLKGNVDVGFLCNAHFARRRSAVGFVPIAAPIITGHDKPKFKVYIIVHKDSGLKSLDDLRGRSVDFADPLSTTSIYAAYALRKKNATIKSYFDKAIYSGSHDMTIQLVANKLVDAGFIDGHIWDYHDRMQPLYSSRTKVIHKSSEFTIPPVVVSRTTPVALRMKLRDILLSMHKDPAGRAILEKLRIEKFVAIKDNDYEDVTRMYKMVGGSL